MRLASTILAVLLLVGCDEFPESNFYLTADSPLPGGVLEDPEVASVNPRSAEIWIYTDGRAVLRVLDGSGKLALKREGTFSDDDVKTPRFWVTFNGIESELEQQGLTPNVKVVSDNPATRAAPEGDRDQGG